MESQLRLLVVEDVATEAELAVRQIKSAGIACTWRRVETEREIRDALRDFRPGLILSDFTLPRFDGLAALDIAAAEAPDVPFIFVSGTIGEERAIEALRRGAVDYVLKTNLKRLVPAVKRALDEAAVHAARQRAEEHVRRLTRVLQMLSGINTAVVRIRDRAALLEEACRIAHRVGNYEFAFVALIDPGTRIAHPIAWAGSGAERRSEACFRIGENAALDSSATGRVLRTGEVIVCDDLAQYQGPISNHEREAAPNVRCLTSLPLRVDDTPVGAFTVGALGQGAVSQEELCLLEEVAANLSFALQYLHKENAIRRLSYFDPLTGLARRTLFCERLARRLAAHEGASAQAAVVVFDVERLSAINDSLGRFTGDLLLQCIADRLRQYLSDTEHLAHLEGGTFAALMTHVDPTDPTLQSLHQQIATIFGRPLLVAGQDIPMFVKCGVAPLPASGGDAEALVQNAEAALHKAKTCGVRYLRHRPEMNSEVAERLGIEHRLRRALDQNQFRLHYQPQVDQKTGHIVGAEALLRWVDPERGLVPPAAFLHVLESTGLIVPVGEWVLQQAAEDCKRWQRLGLAPVRVGVNVSPVQLRRRNFGAHFLTLAGFRAWASCGLDVEITEEAMLDEPASLSHTLQILRGEGVRIAIDDFGTGYSSLGRLSALPVDTLKIDQSFTSRLTSHQRSHVVVSTIITLARSLGLDTIAEGVETVEQLEILEALGCGQSQGYLHSPPVPAEKLEALLAADLRSVG